MYLICFGLCASSRSPGRKGPPLRGANLARTESATLRLRYIKKAAGAALDSADSSGIGRSGAGGQDERDLEPWLGSRPGLGPFAVLALIPVRGAGGQDERDPEPRLRCPSLVLALV